MQVLNVTIELPTSVPILAKAVKAGFPSPADNFIEDEIELQRLLIANLPATFLVRVAGDSMMLDKLCDGDIAVVDRSLNPQRRDRTSRRGAGDQVRASDRRRSQ